MSTLEFHPAAQQFPLLTQSRLDELAEDIRRNGQREAIRLINGKIVDGRNRYLACRKVGIEPRIEQLTNDTDPFAYVWSLNGERRDLTADQRYLIWKSCARQSGQWDAINQQIQQQANDSRSQSQKKTICQDRPSTDCGRSMPAPRGCGSSLRAKVSKTNRGAVERMERLERERSDLAEQVREGSLSSAQAMREISPSRPHIANNSGDNEWYTPKEYIETARQVMGGIDLDPASCQAANEVIQAKKFYTQQENGLSKSWSGRIWMNPPYAQPAVQRFCEKLVHHVKNEDVSHAIVLVNNATETKWGQLLLSHASAICFPSSRIKFWHPDKVSAPLQGQMLVYFGNQVESFSRAFQRVGAVCYGK